MKKFLPLLVLVASSCGSGNTYHMPGSALTLPSLPDTVQIGPADQSSAAAPAPVAGGILTGAHLVTWHTKRDGTNSIADHATLVPCRSDVNPVGLPCEPNDLPPPADPVRDGYDSCDPNIIDAQNAEFAANGIVPWASWWGPAGTPQERSGDLWLDCYLARPAPVRIGILYEMAGLLIQDAKGYAFDGSPDGQENARRLEAHLAHLNAKYFQRHPDRFFRINGRVVVFLWVSGAIYGDFEAAVSALPSRALVYLVGAEVNLYGPGRPDFERTVAGLDAVSAYGIYDRSLVLQHGRLNAAYASAWLRGLMAWAQWLRVHAPHVKIIMPVGFAYDDTKVPGRNNPPLKATLAEADAFASLARETLDQALKNCSNFLPLINATSYNEAYEGSSIEPNTRYGTGLLDIIRKRFAEAPAPASCG